MMVGFFYDRTHTRLIKDYGGMARPMPVAAAFFSLFVLGSLGLPGLSGFVGEFLILVGVFQYAKVFAVHRLDRRSSWARPTCCGCTSGPCSSRPTRSGSRSRT